MQHAVEGLGVRRLLESLVVHLVRHAARKVACILVARLLGHQFCENQRILEMDKALGVLGLRDQVKVVVGIHFGRESGSNKLFG